MKNIKVELTEEDAYLFKEFMKRIDVIGYIIGYMDATGVSELRNASITMDIDNNGIIQHTSITKHFRR